MGTIGLLNFIPVHVNQMPRQILLNVVNESDWTVYEQVKNKNIVGTSGNSSDFTLTFFAILYVGMALTASVVIIFSLISSYRFLRLNENKFSRKTKELYLALLHSLTFDAILGTILVMCPVFAVILSTFTSQYTPLVGIIGIRIVSLYQILINIILFYVVKPYRKSIVRKCRQLFIVSIALFS
ncbi:serpentine type 7TM GPCR chemoreceptor srh domain-containing protein [Ditylenchus destructor]|uniref:Serpentine type 7TM GPCR chemoreceptor srh domain-containing protein n=1 Tax=Ditylenchus destructor TaxID=166010 RepID=A0AAD4QZJ0_9BILA|nr:serpentine type 7TM GPCR chemoreceptor srh domain-containing protein [Ditylenchus destructor]